MICSTEQDPFLAPRVDQRLVLGQVVGIDQITGDHVDPAVVEVGFGPPHLSPDYPHGLVKVFDVVVVEPFPEGLEHRSAPRHCGHLAGGVLTEEGILYRRQRLSSFTRVHASILAGSEDIPEPTMAGAIGAQGNSVPSSLFPFTADLRWGVTTGLNSSGGYSLSLLACALPGAVLLFAAAVRLGRSDPRPAWLALAAWTLAACLAVRLIESWELRLGGVRLDGGALAMVVYGAAVVVLMAFAVIRRDEDGPGLLAATLALASIVPTSLLLAVGTLPVADGMVLVLFAAGGAVCLAVLLRLAASTHRPQGG